jgi:uncharacterized protein (DUF885 family)
MFGTRDQREIFHRMRTDPSLRLRDTAELLELSRSALDRATKALPEWFGWLPPTPCELALIPEHEALNAAPAYYSPPDPTTGRRGTYWVNPHGVSHRAKYDVEATLFHEALPGHHLQLSIAQGLSDLPLFRRVATFGSYTEGWGLYCERLADEMGLYSAELDRLGMLAFDSWRACRLVVDTGLHALGWSYQEATQFMQSHTALPEAVIRAEVDRYVGLPGQALSYMVGRLEFHRLRQHAEQHLAEAFALQSFHDEVLRHGALPLTVLADVVDAWISKEKAP